FSGPEAGQLDFQPISGRPQSRHREAAVAVGHDDPLRAGPNLRNSDGGARQGSLRSVDDRAHDAGRCRLLGCGDRACAQYERKTGADDSVQHGATPGRTPMRVGFVVVHDEGAKGRAGGASLPLSFTLRASHRLALRLLLFTAWTNMRVVSGF